MALYVRTASGGTGPDVILNDLGITVETSATWVLLSSADGYGPENAGGQFSAIELKESQDLYDALTGTPTLEWSTDGSTARSDPYDMDVQFVIEAQNNDWDLSFGRLTLPNKFNGFSNPRPGDLYYDADDGYLAFYDGSQTMYVALTESGTVSDHGALAGLLDDDHTQYLLLAGGAVRNTVTGTINLTGGRLELPSDANPTANFATPVAGEIAYDSDDGYLVVYNGSAWVNVTNGVQHDTLSGLLDDDHTQYALLTGDSSRNNITGTFNFGDGYLIAPTYNIAPTTSVIDGALAIVDGVMYSYDGTRSKWLSVDRKQYWAARDNGGVSNTYLYALDSVPTSVTGYRVLRNGTITGLVAQTSANSTWTLQVRRNGVVTAIATLSLSATTGSQTTTTNVDVSQGDRLQLFASGSSIANPVAGLEIAWRI
jgi:hypothetical protein